jgi:hypothetical protein
MKAKLIKTEVNYLLEDDKGVVIASTSLKEGFNSLSKQNCDEIFGVVDVIDVIYKKVRNGFDGDLDSFTEAFAKECINKAIELSKDKMFTESDIFSVVNHILSKLVKVDGFDQKYLFPEEVYQEVTWKTKQIQQPTEIEVEIEMFRGNDIKSVARDWGQIGEPKLDSNGCLILKKK